MKVFLFIVKEGNEYRAVVDRGENPKPPAGKRIIFTLEEKVEQTEGHDSVKVREITRELKKKAQKRARQAGIRYVINLDPDPYPLGRR